MSEEARLVSGKIEVAPVETVAQKIGRRIRAVRAAIGDNVKKHASQVFVSAYDINADRKYKTGRVKAHLRREVITKSKTTQHIPETPRQAIANIDSFYMEHKTIIDQLIKIGLSALRLWVWYTLFERYYLLEPDASFVSKAAYRGLQAVVVVDVLYAMGQVQDIKISTL